MQRNWTKKIRPNKSVQGLILLLVVFIIFISCGPTTKRTKKRFKPKSCLECHQERLPDFEKKFVHAPVEAKDCEACHTRHGRLAVKSFIDNVESRVCYTCHSEMGDRMKELPQLHTVLKQGACVPCHDPHASDKTFLQKNTGS